MVDVAAVALVPGHPGLALALPLRVALETPGPDLVAFAGNAVAVFAHVVLFAAALAVGAVAVGGAVQAVASVAGQSVEFFVIIASIREPVAVAFWK